jgi:hypothetical protein
MNERIWELAEQAEIEEGRYERYKGQDCDLKAYSFLPDQLEKFAELIVRECMEQIHIQSRGPCGDYHGQWFESGILKHFGVEE